MSRAPTGFLPIEDQGYLRGRRAASGWRQPRPHAENLAAGGADRQLRSRRRRVITIAGISVLDNSASLANGGVAYIMLEGLERPRQRPGSRLALQNRQRQADQHGGRERTRSAASADPGHRQRRRFLAADRASRRQLRSYQAGKRHERCHLSRERAIRHPAHFDIVPGQRAASTRCQVNRERCKHC